MTKTFYTATSEYVDEIKAFPVKSQVSVSGILRQMGMKAQWVKPYVQTTIGSDFSQKLKNVLNEEFNPERPDAVWCSDITYIWTFEGFLYLTSIMDLYSRKIIS